MANNNKIEESSRNIFSAIGLPDAEELLIKAKIVRKIEEEIKNRALTQSQAAKLMGIPQPRVSQIINGKFQDISEYKLIHCLIKLGYNVNIQVEKSSTTNHQNGHINLFFA